MKWVVHHHQSRIYQTWSAISEFCALTVMADWWVAILLLKRVPNHFSDMHGPILFKLRTNTVHYGKHMPPHLILRPDQIWPTGRLNFSVRLTWLRLDGFEGCGVVAEIQILVPPDDSIFALHFGFLLGLPFQ